MCEGVSSLCTLDGVISLFLFCDGVRSRRGDRIGTVGEWLANLVCGIARLTGVRTPIAL